MWASLKGGGGVVLRLENFVFEVPRKKCSPHCPVQSVFVAMEEEGAELRRMRAELQLMKTQREAERKVEAAAAAAAAGGSAAAPDAAVAAPAVATDGYTIQDLTPEPRVRPWNGGDVAWHTSPSANDDAAEDSIVSSALPVAGGSRRRPRGRYEAFALRVVYEAGRTGFEEAKDFTATVGSVIAGRYKVRHHPASCCCWCC